MTNGREEAIRPRKTTRRPTYKATAKYNPTLSKATLRKMNRMLNRPNFLMSFLQMAKAHHKAKMMSEKKLHREATKGTKPQPKPKRMVISLQLTGAERVAWRKIRARNPHVSDAQLLRRALYAYTEGVGRGVRGEYTTAFLWSPK